MTHTQAWDECLKIIKQLVEPQQFQTWFTPIKSRSLEDSKLSIEVPTDFFRQYLDSAFLEVLSKTLRRVLGPEAKLNYITPVVGEMLNNPSEEYIKTDVETTINTNGGYVNPFVLPGTLPKVKINPRLIPIYSFDNLVIGECNKMGITIGKEVALKPGKTFNPFFIFGGPGLGKTHLAHAIGIAVKKKYPDAAVLYVSGSEFKNQYVNAAAVQNKIVDFLAFYKRIDVLIVDDMQDMQGAATQRAFFEIFNHLHQSGKQLIFTSDRAPKDLQNFEERMLSRFKWGLSVKLSQPDYQTRLNMLRSRAEREGLKLPEEVYEFIASTVKTNFRELEGTLISVMAHASVERKRSYLEIAASITENLIGEQKTEVSIDKVQKTVCDYFNISREDMLSKSRKRQIVQARQIAMYLCRNLISNCSLATIGAEIGGKDHATVLHACVTVSDLMQTDKVFKKYVNDIESALLPYA